MVQGPIQDVPNADLLAGLGLRPHRAPSKSAIRRAFARLDAARLEAILAAWLWTRTAVVDRRRVIAIDGRTVRGAQPRQGKQQQLACPAGPLALFCCRAANEYGFVMRV
jgi:hypothetical protein